MNHKYRAKRRQLLKRSAIAALLGTGGLSTHGKLDIIGSALAASGDYASLTDYKALVCVFLYGGSDSFNMFLPTGEDAFNAYATSRAGLSVPQASLLSSGTGDHEIAFNSLLPQLHSLYESGQLAVVQNVGNLIQPVTRAQYLSEASSIPVDLFAHNHQQEQWQKGLSSLPTSVVEAGWGGRIADLLHEANQGSSLPPTFSMSGSNHWQTGANTTPLTLNSTNGLELLPFTDSQTGGLSNVLRESAVQQIMALQQSHPMLEQVGKSFIRARDGSRAVRDVLDNGHEFQTAYNNGSPLARQLRMVAKLIAGRSALSMRRQIFYVGMGGWDTHDNQGIRLNTLMQDLDQSLSDFQSALAELQIENSVTTFSASDFGRTLTTNGDGTDHGWGGHQVVLGGAVQGGKLYGQMPSFETGGDDDAGDKGRIIPSTSVNQLGAALAMWMGLSKSDTLEVFPDLANFGSSWQVPLFS